MVGPKPPKHGRSAFTFIEVLMALMVTSIIFTAIATLTFSLGAANDSTNDTAQKQARLRYATLRISELIKHCKLICASPANTLAIWRTDDNGDGKINVNELVYIETGQFGDCLQLCEFHSSSNPIINLSTLKFLWTKWWLKNNHDFTETLILQCGNVQFWLDAPAPYTQFVNISFDLQEDGAMHNYHINASLRAKAGNLLDRHGDIVSTDDD